MFENFQRWVALRKLEQQSRKNDDGTISFSNAVSRISEILMCLPWDYREFRVARYVLKSLDQEDVDHRITFVAPEEYRNLIPRRKHDRILTINGTGRDHLGRFTSDFVERVLDHEYQAAADFNTEFDFGTSLLCRRSDAPIRIGFAFEYARVFYNIEIRKPEDKFLLEGAYRSVQRMLAIESVKD